MFKSKKRCCPGHGEDSHAIKGYDVGIPSIEQPRPKPTAKSLDIYHLCTLATSVQQLYRSNHLPPMRGSRQNLRSRDGFSNRLQWSTLLSLRHVDSTDDDGRRTKWPTLKRRRNLTTRLDGVSRVSQGQSRWLVHTVTTYTLAKLAMSKAPPLQGGLGVVDGIFAKVYVGSTYGRWVCMHRTQSR